ncbi:MAG: phosphonate ABC transporter, permease protein PhnE [Bdellovibrionales bacterium]|nr:phosphonate ABC transporter, permease protein PhnE [Bdellovibrionales bacterium]
MPTKTSTPTKSGHGFWLYAGALVFLGVFSSLSISLQGVSTTNFFSLALKTFGSFVPSSWNNILQMNWLELAQVMLETFGMAFWGTLVGTIASIPLAVLCSNNLFPTFVFRPLRLVMTFIRTVPSVIWGLVFVAAAGLGAISGIAALALYTTGYLTKLIYEGLEDLDRMSFLALRQLGASRFQAFWYAVKPDSYSVIISNSLFMLEYNFRGASLLGLVGAGGIGQTLMYYIEWRQFEKAGVIISLMFICVLILDSLSEKLRKLLNSHKIS